MRRLLVLVAAVLLVTVTHGFAAPIGPLWTKGDRGLFFGLGYSYVDADWEPDTEGAVFYNTENLETQQHQVQLQLGLVFAKGWSAYAGGGFSTINAEHAFRGSDADAEAGTDISFDNAEDEFFPYGTAGVHGLLIDGKSVDVGVFAQVNYQSEYKDEVFIGTQTFVTTSGSTITDTFVEEFKLEMAWDGVAGLLFQGELEGAFLYGGPIVFTSKAKAKSIAVGQTTGEVSVEKTSIEESEEVGAVAGIRWQLKNGTSLDLELQKRSQISVGLALNTSF